MPTSYALRSGLRVLRNMLVIVLVGILFFLVGCATTSTTGTRTTEQQLRADMVMDLLSVVPQIMDPLNTTIQFNDEESGEVQAVVLKLVELGYGLQRVDADQGKNFLRVSDVTLPADAENSVTRLRLSVGQIEFTRPYKVLSRNDEIDERANLVWRGNNAFVPAGPMLVAGTQERIAVDGFELANGATGAGATELVLTEGGAQYTSLAPIVGGIPSILLITKELVDEVAQLSGPGLSLLYADTFKLENMTHVFDQAFASVSDNYNRIGRETVIFPNDSQFLGRTGKRIVKKLINRYSENTDIVGIIGCSNGTTSLNIGNEGLALGRAIRIAEEFYTAGVSRDKVFNEGCWSTDGGVAGFPNRGVVIDLWRRKG